MEARLLETLHGKLEDLENQISAYRLELIADFQLYYRALIKEANPEVACHIERAITQSLQDYPTLRPELQAADSRAPDNLGSAAFQQPSTSTDPARIEASEYTRGREIELQGLFTPNYLPLLEYSPPELQPTLSVATTTSSSSAAAAPLAADLSEQLPPVGYASAGIATGFRQVAVMDGLLETSSEPTTPPAAGEAGGGIARAGTDDSTSSVCSDKSDSKVRRSALRRSSSLSKPPQSPRQVRFKITGGEVLPTSSPQPSGFITPIAATPFPDDDTIHSDAILGADEEEFAPPRKISSSDALRALSRAPMDEGTVWTVVNPETDDTLSLQLRPSNTLEQSKSAETVVPINPIYSAGRAAATPELDNTELMDGSEMRGLNLMDPVPDFKDDENDYDDSSSDEEDFLAMASSKSKMTPPLPPVASPKVNYDAYPTESSPMNKTLVNSNSAGASTETESYGDEDADQFDDMFHFEPTGLTAPPKPRQRPPSPTPEEPSDDEAEETEEPNDTNSRETPTKKSHFATSPAVSFTRPQRMGPTSPPVTRFQPGSLGSYKGRPVIMPVVKYPEVHARAASLGQFNTFVGGLDGRSGMDEGDLSSFRASVVQPAFSGTPRSFTERFMMEEAQAERRRNKSST